MTRVLLVHGAALTSTCWDPLRTHLRGHRVDAPRRPSTGNLHDELAFLAPLAEGAVVVGVSDGATLVLALAASSVTMAAAIAHEPAAGSLQPKLLAPMLAALGAGGVDEFARALYGPTWRRPVHLDDDAVRRDIAMFRTFEPQRARPGQGHVLVTTGSESPAIRHSTAAALQSRLGYSTAPIARVGHYIQKENPTAFAALVRATLAGVPERGFASGGAPGAQ